MIEENPKLEAARREAIREIDRVLLEDEIATARFALKYTHPDERPWLYERLRRIAAEAQADWIDAVSFPFQRRLPTPVSPRDIVGEMLVRECEK